jgi:TldD protein
MRTLAQPTARGWEWMSNEATNWDWNSEVAQLPELLVQKRSSPSVTPGQYTLLLHPSNLWLTIHESIGHATELDRAQGYEANYAGTSFATPENLNRLQYGSPLLNVTGDRNAEHGLSSIAFDDEGVATGQWDLIKDGLLVGYQTDRRSATYLSQPRSSGSAFADSASHIPIQRMPNVSMAPAPAGPSIQEMISTIENGIYVLGDNSWSIDMQRYNFQFTGQQFHRIIDGEIVGQVKDVAYQSSTIDFWNSLSQVGGPETYVLGGAFNCGKAQPSQVAAVSHGCPAARFENINILNTAAGA